MLRRYRSNRRHLLEILGKMDALLGAVARLEDTINRAHPRPEPRNPFDA